MIRRDGPGCRGVILFRKKKSGSKILECSFCMAVYDHAVQAKGLCSNELQLGDEKVGGIGGGADEAMLATDEAEEKGKLEVSQVMDFVEDGLIRHG